MWTFTRDLPNLLTSAVATVSELQAQRRRGWDRAGTPDWARWWPSELAVENPELTGMERQKRIGDPLQKETLRQERFVSIRNDC